MYALTQGLANAVQIKICTSHPSLPTIDEIPPVNTFESHDQ